VQRERIRSVRHRRPWVSNLVNVLPTTRLTPSSNAEEMLTEEGTPKTSHTTNKVPFVMANAPEGWSLKKTDGVLGDVAPTVLAVMGLQQPEAMDGHSLLVKS
jgi:bisphosphoglycerate-independent phosphoglycerate mutase (AlkP superfamily)